MGTLRHHQHGQEHTLSSQHLIGRAPGCHLRLQSPRVSGRHAELRWTGAAWELCDLASTNGVFVDGRRLEPGEHRIINAGAMLAFGHADNLYELIRDDPPCASATSTDGTRCEARQGPLLLPNPTAPERMVYREDNIWYVDSPEQSPRPIESGDTLQIGDTTWTLDLPLAIEKTAAADPPGWSLDALTLRFHVSRDEEHVELELDAGAQQRRLPPSVCWDTLLTLARERINDRKQGISDPEAGWMDVPDLQNKLDLEIDALNQQVFRAKHALLEAGVRGHAGLIERRRVRKIRLGTGRIDIVRAR